MPKEIYEPRETEEVPESKDGEQESLSPAGQRAMQGSDVHTSPSEQIEQPSSTDDAQQVSDDKSEKELGDTGYMYGPKKDGSGTYWYNKNNPNDYGHETTRTDGSKVSHYRHESGGPAKGWTYDKDTGESVKK